MSNVTADDVIKEISKAVKRRARAEVRDELRELQAANKRLSAETVRAIRKTRELETAVKRFKSEQKHFQRACTKVIRLHKMLKELSERRVKSNIWHHADWYTVEREAASIRVLKTRYGTKPVTKRKPRRISRKKRSR